MIIYIVVQGSKKTFSWTSPGPVASENGQALIFSDKPEKYGKINYFLPLSLLLYICFFLDSVKQCYLYTKNMQWHHRSVRIALCDINKKAVEIGERQNRCYNDTFFYHRALLPQMIACFELWSQFRFLRLNFHKELNKYRLNKSLNVHLRMNMRFAMHLTI